MSSELMFIQDGQPIYIGRPARPIEDQVQKRIMKTVISSGIITESHLPHVYIPGMMSTSGPALFILTSASLDKVSKAVEQIVASAPGVRLLVLPLSEQSPLWEMVRKQQCQLS